MASTLHVWDHIVAPTQLSEGSIKDTELSSSSLGLRVVPPNDFSESSLGGSHHYFFPPALDNSQWVPEHTPPLNPDLSVSELVFSPALDNETFSCFFPQYHGNPIPYPKPCESPDVNILAPEISGLYKPMGGHLSRDFWFTSREAQVALDICNMPVSYASLVEHPTEVPRQHESYQRGPHEDGLYHCPFEITDKCKHKPHKLRNKYW